jgi:hypothetical protein
MASFLDTLRGRTPVIETREADRMRDAVATAREANQLADTVELYQERIAELEFALEDRNWLRMSAESSREFSRDALRRITQLCRINYLKNPLIKRAVNVVRFYMWAQGINFKSRNDDVDALLHAFWDDGKNRQSLTSLQALGKRDTDLMLGGNLFVAFFVNPSTGWTRVRAFPVDEIAEIVTDPEDRDTPWFYKRVWTEQLIDYTGGSVTGEQRKTAYPDWRYASEMAADSARPTKIGEFVIDWGVPVMHIATGGTSDMRFGVPEVYAALDWARAVKEDLEDYATTKRALARYAWSLIVKGGQPAVAAAKKRLGTTISTNQGDTLLDRNPPAVTASTFISSDGAAKLDPIRTAGAQANPEEGRALRLMTAASVDLPETILMGDSKSGNLATAKTLDRPTELRIKERQAMWKAIIGDVFTFVIKQAILAPNHPLEGTVEKDPVTEQEVITITGGEGDDALSFDITFPDVLEHDPELTVQAIIDAATLGGSQSAGTLPDRAISKALMNALGWSDTDSLLDDLYPEGDETAPTGNLTPPPAPVLPGAPPGGATKKQQEAMLAALRDVRTAALALSGKNGQ